MRTGPRPPRARQSKGSKLVNFRTVALLSLILLAGCRKQGDVIAEKYGVYTIRSACPVVGIPAGTGDITLFNPVGSSDSRAIDVTATMTDLRGTCGDSGNDVVSTVTFTITALRRDAGPARQVGFTYFNAALRGGSAVAAKQLGQAVINFAPGDIHGWTRVQASVRVNRAAATLPANVRAILNRPRKAGDADAALDPLADPEVRTAVANATFEHLVGFQLSQEQLRYNVTR